MQCGMSGPASGSGQVTATSAVAAARGTTLAWWTGEPPTPRIWRTGGSTKIKFALDAGDGRARKGWKIYTRGRVRLDALRVCRVGHIPGAPNQI
jgi:hypothetical protein